MKRPLNQVEVSNQIFEHDDMAIESTLERNLNYTETIIGELDIFDEAFRDYESNIVKIINKIEKAINKNFENEAMISYNTPFEVVQNSKVVLNIYEMVTNMIGYGDISINMLNDMLNDVVDSQQGSVEVTKPKGKYISFLEEVKKDLEIEKNKNETIEGYKLARKLLNLVPENYQYLVHLDEDDNVLCFDTCKLGEINDIEEYQYLENGLTTEIDITRTNGEIVKIQFKHGKNEETKKYEYIGFNVILGK